MYIYIWKNWIFSISTGAEFLFAINSIVRCLTFAIGYIVVGHASLVDPTVQDEKIVSLGVLRNQKTDVS